MKNFELNIDLAMAILKRDDEAPRFFKDIFENDEYAVAKQQNIVIDLGANIGNFSFYIYPYARQIYAVEADLDNYIALLDFVTRYNLDKIKPFHLAIAGESGTRNLYVNGGTGGYSIIKANNDSQIKGQIEAKTLAQFMSEQEVNHVNILKIDVECAENEIFAAPDFGSIVPKIDSIIGEVHQESVEQILINHGYKFSQERNIFQAYRI